MPVRLVVPRTGRVVALRVDRAVTAGARARGLLGRRPLGPGEALVLEPARQVHTFGLTYPIDVCFCDRAWRVVHVVSSMPPRRVTRWVRRARYAVETRAGELHGVRPGDQLSLEELNER
ncbi:MAG: DUF192 domain-containing protein [Actinomycetota bacterium]|nr:DUF192 domain-containing protein [Actinomycetota bacterium]